MGKKIFRVFLAGFLRAVFVMVCMAVCAALGFFGTRKYYQWKDGKAVSDGTVATVDEVSKNLIYVWDDEKKTISDCVLEVLDTNESTMAYFTIPLRAQMTLSTDMFQKLYRSNPEIPQIVKISQLTKYFQSEDDAFGGGQMILEDFFGIDISYYTVVKKADFQKAFEKKKVSTGGGKKRSGNVLREDFLQDMSKYTDKSSLKKYLSKTCEKVKSNLSTRKKLSFVSDYLKVKDDISYYCLPYTKNGGIDEIQVDKAKVLLGRSGVTGTEQKQTSDSDSTDTQKQQDVSMQLKNIIILNSTGVTGLAKQWQDKLTGYGYNVLSIGNYSPQQKTTKIIVTKDEVGQEFSLYFKDMIIEKGEVEQGADAQIILGTDDVE